MKVNQMILKTRVAKNGGPYFLQDFFVKQQNCGLSFKGSVLVY